MCSVVTWIDPTPSRAELARWSDDGGAGPRGAGARSPRPRTWSTTDHEEAGIARRIASMAAPRVLEIGSFDGRTTRVLVEAAASKGGVVVVIDPMRWAAETLSEGLATAAPPSSPPWLHALDDIMDGVSYEAAFWQNVGPRAASVTLRRNVSTCALLIASEDPCLAAFDVALLGGEHGYEAVSSDLVHWAARVVPGGTFYVRDATLDFPEVLRALSEYAATHHVTVVAADTADSLATVHVHASM